MDRKIREGIRYLLALGESGVDIQYVVSREERLRLLRLLSQGHAAYELKGLGRDISQYDPMQGVVLNGETNWSPFKYINARFATLAEVDRHLASHGLPPLREWEVNDDGFYTTSMTEDAAATPDENGGFLVDYTLEVNLTYAVQVLPTDV